MVTVESKFLTIKEVAAYLNLPDQKIYNLVRHREFPGIKIGRRWWVDKGKLDLWLDKDKDGN